MFGFLGFILIFILLIVFVVIALLGNLVRAIFGIGKRTPKHVHEETHQTRMKENTLNTKKFNKVLSFFLKEIFHQRSTVLCQETLLYDCLRMQSMWSIPLIPSLFIRRTKYKFPHL